MHRFYVVCCFLESYCTKYHTIRIVVLKFTIIVIAHSYSAIMKELYIESVLLIFLIIITRILYLMHKIVTGFSSSPKLTQCKTVICIGSGGHTTEMLLLIETLDFTRYSPRFYIVAENDKTSTEKIHSVEKKQSYMKDFEINYIPRSRNVGQSYLTSVFTTAYSILYCIPIMCKIRPNLILCNGPGTCIPVCVIAFLLKAAFICDTRIVFIESFCRTQSFSLSGNILKYIADNIIVQWPTLKRKLKRADYIGQLM